MGCRFRGSGPAGSSTLVLRSTQEVRRNVDKFQTLLWRLVRVQHAYKWEGKANYLRHLRTAHNKNSTSRERPSPRLLERVGEKGGALPA